MIKLFLGTQKKLVVIVTLLAASFLLVSCKPVSVFTEKEIPCDSPVVSDTTSQSSPLEVNLHVDGSGSMLGYVQSGNSRYIQTLELLDSVFLSGGSRPDIKVNYFRSGGDKNQNVKRAGYRQAESPDFYTGKNPQFPGVGSALDVAITPPGQTDKFLVFVTDLAQNDSDVTKLADRIEETYLKPNQGKYAVGILAIKSEFNGKVYSTNSREYSEFLYQTAGKDDQHFRPFYVVLIAPYKDLIYYHNQMLKAESDLMKGSEFSVFYAGGIGQKVAVFESKASLPEGITNPLSLNNGKVSVELKKPPYETIEIDKGVDKAIDIPYTVSFSPLEHTLQPDPQSITPHYDIKVYDSFEKKFIKPPNETVLKQSLEVKNWSIGKDSLQFNTVLNPSIFPEPNIYVLQVDAVVGDLQDADWWKKWDWRSKENSNDGSKTYGFLQLMQNLKRTTVSLINPDLKTPNDAAVLGRFCYAIQKD